MKSKTVILVFAASPVSIKEKEQRFVDFFICDSR